MAGGEESTGPGPRVCHFCGFSVEIAASLDAFLGRFLRCYAAKFPDHPAGAERLEMRGTLVEYLEDMVEVPTWKSVGGKRRKVAKWAHENCANWSVGVYSKHGKRQGIPVALATARAAACWLCDRIGASVCCDVATLPGHSDVVCRNVLHFPCALLLFEEDHLHMDSDGLMMYCPPHQHLALEAPAKSQPTKQPASKPSKKAPVPAKATATPTPTVPPVEQPQKTAKPPKKKAADSIDKPQTKGSVAQPPKKVRPASPKPTPGQPQPTPSQSAPSQPQAIPESEATIAPPQECPKPKPAEVPTATELSPSTPTHTCSKEDAPLQLLAATLSPPAPQRESTGSLATSTPSLASDLPSPAAAKEHSPSPLAPVTAAAPCKPAPDKGPAPTVCQPPPGPPQAELVSAIAAVLRYETFMATDALVEQLSSRLAGVSLPGVLAVVRDLHDKSLLFYDEASKAVYTL
eukprot:EG_transcript_9164